MKQVTKEEFEAFLAQKKSAMNYRELNMCTPTLGIYEYKHNQKKAATVSYSFGETETCYYIWEPEDWEE